MPDTTLNLDNLAAERAQKMVSEAKNGVDGVKNPVETMERLATKALGVLQAQGVYAMMLFLFSRSSDEAKIAPFIRKELYQAVQALPGFQSENIQDDPQSALGFFSERIQSNLDILLLVRDLYEQILIYARYHAKAVVREAS